MTDITKRNWARGVLVVIVLGFGSWAGGSIVAIKASRYTGEQGAAAEARIRALEEREIEARTNWPWLVESVEDLKRGQRELNASMQAFSLEVAKHIAGDAPN